jgi:hypothetical protein
MQMSLKVLKIRANILFEVIRPRNECERPRSLFFAATVKLTDWPYSRILYQYCWLKFQGAAGPGAEGRTGKESGPRLMTRCQLKLCFDPFARLVIKKFGYLKQTGSESKTPFMT